MSEMFIPPAGAMQFQFNDDAKVVWIEGKPGKLVYRMLGCECQNGFVVYPGQGVRAAEKDGTPAVCRCHGRIIE